MSNDTIQNLEDLIQKYTGPGKKVVASDVTRLTAPGENYMGIVLKVEATLQNEDGKEECFSAVAKCLNFNVDEHMKKILPVQYKKEKAFYAEVIPTLQDFVDETKVELNFSDIFPKMYAFRSSLEDNTDEPDENAVLLFENLNPKGYSNIDRTVGFDVEGAKLVLKDMAAFHALPIALKLKKPDVFKNKVKKHLYKPFEGSGDKGPPPLFKDGKSPHDLWLEILQEYEEVQPYFKQLETKLKSVHEMFKELKKKVPGEPFASIAHTDLWTNNTMQKVVNGKIAKNKLIDFQLYAYDTPADDLIFFLWTSVQLHLIRNEFDNLVRFYHNAFVDILDKFGCDTTQFSYQNFLKEINGITRFAFEHIIFMLIPIFGKKGESVFDVNEGPMNMRKENISEAARKRAALLVADFGQRGWLK